MKKAYIPVLLIMAVLGTFFVKGKSFSGAAPSPSPTPKIIDFIASFEIVKNGKKTDFNNPKYFNINNYAYISPLDPQFIHIKKDRIIWKDFFATLEIKIPSSAKFTLNNLNEPNAMNMEITPGAKLLIESK